MTNSNYLNDPAKRLANAFKDIRKFSGILAAGYLNESDRLFINEHLQIAIDTAEELTVIPVVDIEAVPTSDAHIDMKKRVSAEVIAERVIPSFNYEVWTDNDLYMWMYSHNILWLEDKQDWMSLGDFAQGDKHIHALLLIYSAENHTVDTRYCIPTVAFLKVQSMGYVWDSKLNRWDHQEAEEKPFDLDKLDSKYHSALTIIASLKNEPLQYVTSMIAYSFLKRRGIEWDETLQSWTAITPTNM